MENAHAQWVALLILGALLLATAIYGWRASIDATVNRYFAMHTLVVTWWVIGIAGTHSAHATEFWGRWTFTASALAPAAFLAFTQVFPTRDITLPRALAAFINPAAAAIAVISATTPWIVHSFVVTSGVLTRKPGPLMWAFSAYLVISAATILLFLTAKWRASRGLARAQLRLYYLGLLFFCVGAITTNLLLPSVVGDSRYSVLGPCFVLIFLAFVSHGIIRHRLMNVRLVIHNWLTFSIASGIASVPLIVVILVVSNPFRESASMAAVTFLVFAGAMGPPIWVQTRRLLHRYISRGDADFQTLIGSASSRLSRVLAPAQSADVIADTIFEAVRPEGVAIYTAPDGYDHLTLMHCRIGRPNFAQPSVLPRTITHELTAVPLLASFQSVAVDPDPSVTRMAADVLEANHWVMLIPLAGETQLLGAIAVGAKMSGDPYYLEDIALLRVLASQATVAFSNGRLYERVLLANQHIENIVATVQSGILVAYDKTAVRLMNDEAVRLLAISPSPQSGTLFPASELPPEIREILNRTFDSGIASQGVELVGLPIMCATTPLRRSDGDIVGVVAALSDLSTLKALEIERTRSERLTYFETLAAGLAHEIANPIAPIKIMAQLLPSRVHSESFVAEFTRTVTREILRIENLVGRLQCLSGPSNRAPAPVDLRVSLREAFDVMYPLFENRRVGLVLEPHDGPTIVNADSSELQELFLNLLMNAVEATPAQGLVTIRTAVEGTEARIDISDTGSGIKPDALHRIFEPFVSSKQRGSGLGLTICNGIVRRHGGTITAQNHDHGAVFTVRMPLSTKANLTTSTAHTPSTRPAS
jgi:signal transduction histidine kinase